jgi:diguanylate cyclase (GGDEF)-like protein
VITGTIARCQPTASSSPACSGTSPGSSDCSPTSGPWKSSWRLPANTCELACVAHRSRSRASSRAPLLSTAAGPLAALDKAAAAAFAKIGTRAMTCMTVVAFDLNDLKQVNDRLGHALGDHLIISAASLVRAHFNGLPGSLAARVGGDEFIVLVPGHSPESVASAAQAACSAVADLEVGAGASCGMATADGTHQDSSVSDLFRRADAALYRSKRAGRLVALDTAGLPEPAVESVASQ